MSAYYETDRGLAEYLLFHYGSEALRMPWRDGPGYSAPFPVRCVAESLEGRVLPPLARALDLGCAVGRATFELARHAETVVGIDRSQRFIQAADHLRQHGALSFEIVDEGDLTTPATATVPLDIDRTRVRFETGDALALGPELGEFDVILAANLLDRVPRPGALLESLAPRLRPGGWLVLTSPYTWLDEHTPRTEWLCTGGRRSTEVLQERLTGFERIRRWDIPFVLREHVRKFQWSVAEATLWQRRD